MRQLWNQGYRWALLEHRHETSWSGGKDPSRAFHIPAADVWIGLAMNWLMEDRKVVKVMEIPDDGHEIVVNGLDWPEDGKICQNCSQAPHGVLDCWKHNGP